MAYFLLFSKYGTTTNPGILARTLEGTLHFPLSFFLSWYDQLLFPEFICYIFSTCFHSFQPLTTYKVELLIVLHLDT